MSCTHRITIVRGDRSEYCVDCETELGDADMPVEKKCTEVEFCRRADGHEGNHCQHLDAQRGRDSISCGECGDYAKRGEMAE